MEGVTVVELVERERQLRVRFGRRRRRRRGERGSHVGADGGEPDVAGDARRLAVGGRGEAHRQLRLRPRVAAHRHRELRGAHDAHRLLELEIADQDGRSGPAGRFQRRRRHRVQRRGERQDGLPGELVVVEVDVVAPRHGHAHAVRGAALGPGRREEHRAGGARLQRGEQRLLSGAVVDERDALLRERCPGESRDARDHRGA